MKIKSALGVLAAAALSLGVVSVAQADPVFTWDYTLEAKWTDSKPGNVIRTDYRLEWGTGTEGQGPSALEISNLPDPSSVATLFGGGQAAPANIGEGPSITHHNNTLTAGSVSLDEATLTATLTLTPTDPLGGDPYSPPALEYKIKFLETVNSLPCEVENYVTVCDDIFVQMTGLLNQEFDYDGQTYYVNIFPVNENVLSVLNDDACTAAGAAPGCIGFTTPEWQSTTLPFGFTISTKPLSNGVPEPASLALLGLGLAGLGALRRRRK